MFHGEAQVVQVVEFLFASAAALYGTEKRFGQDPYCKGPKYARGEKLPISNYNRYDISIYIYIEIYSFCSQRRIHIQEDVQSGA